MFFKLLSLHSWQRLTAQSMCVVLFSLALSKVVNASPGAHGPNGEHLDTSKGVLTSSKPKFESFTESFEVLGELYDSKLVIYLHDFKTNKPIENASIELETDDLSAEAVYSDIEQAYLLTEEKVIERLNAEGGHEIVLTIMTENYGDLLVANLNISNTSYESDHHNDDHHHIPWLEIFVALIVFITGFLLGRVKKEKKS
ncbi:hypothetical protein J1N51_13010 [Psychrosphaera ytuae]|uniref:Uncharacterized protein n=1 Tax=Psychrosphaera ytuae TaxID=2820710 RepID=A0A975HHZ1_9GAMM|nr:hypothetical protein [Psychrosphaera ytuae]QTH63627.1 hypothetical protein J1N51_13010 [Psychrosphaera ytuae]